MSTPAGTGTATVGADVGVEAGGGQRRLTSAERRQFREKYGYLRTYFKQRADRHAGLQRSLNQARAGVIADEYLAGSVRWAALAALVGVLVGVGATLLLERAGAFGAVRAPAELPGEFARTLAANRLLVGGAAVTLLSTLVLGAGVYLGRYYYPATVVSGRRQRIDVTLPHAIVYIYALSYGGMDLTAVIRSLARAENTYGEVAREFHTVVRDVDLFDSDLITGLQNARNLTPTGNFEQFLDEVISVLDSGGDVTGFLNNEANRYLDEASDQQEDFLETLPIMSEVFIVGFVAAPLFLIVILVVELDSSVPNDLGSEINPVSADALEFRSARIVEIGSGNNKQDVLKMEFENVGTADVELTQLRVNTFIATALGGRSGVPDVREVRIVEGTVTNPSALNSATSVDVRGDYESFSSTVSPGTVVYTVQFRDGSGSEIEALEGDMFILSIDYTDVGIGRYLISIDP